jgi:hypothetical protein
VCPVLRTTARVSSVASGVAGVVRLMGFLPVSALSARTRYGVNNKGVRVTAPAHSRLRSSVLLRAKQVRLPRLLH